MPHITLSCHFFIISRDSLRRHRQAKCASVGLAYHLTFNDVKDTEG